MSWIRKFRVRSGKDVKKEHQKCIVLQEFEDRLNEVIFHAGQLVIGYGILSQMHSVATGDTGQQLKRKAKDWEIVRSKFEREMRNLRTVIELMRLFGGMGRLLKGRCKLRIAEWWNEATEKAEEASEQIQGTAKAEEYKNASEQMKIIEGGAYRLWSEWTEYAESEIRMRDQRCQACQKTHAEELLDLESGLRTPSKPAEPPKSKECEEAVGTISGEVHTLRARIGPYRFELSN